MNNIRTEEKQGWATYAFALTLPLAALAGTFAVSVALGLCLLAGQLVHAGLGTALLLGFAGTGLARHAARALHHTRTLYVRS